MEHTVKYDFRGDTLIATCSCGQWKNEQSTFKKGGSLSQIHDNQEALHAEHVKAVQGTKEGET